MFSTPKDFLLPFLKKEFAADKTFTFYFDRRKADLEFVAGQYLRMTLPHENADERGKTRLFSISSSPLDDYMSITTHVIQSSFKFALDSLEEGEKVQFFGPIGRFVLMPNEVKPVVLLSGGIGITPYHSMTRYVSQKNLNIPVTLIASFSTPERIVFKEELENISKTHKNVKIIYTLTRPELSKVPWEGETGRINQEMIKKYVPDIKEPIFYSVGSREMVDSLLSMLKEMGVSEENLRREVFAGY